MTSILCLTQKTIYKRQYIYYIRLHFGNCHKKDEGIWFRWADHLRTKIIIHDEALEKVSQFTYLGCSISYQFSNYVESKLANFYN